MDKIKVDIEELIEILSAVKEDEFATVELCINTGDYTSDYTLSVKAIGLEEEDGIDYGELYCIPEEF